MRTPDIAPSRRRLVLLGTVVLGLLIGLATWRLLPSDPPSAPDEVVREFFQAQRDGDCERLLEIVSEASWSDDGERSRAEFVEQCADAIAGYEPPDDEFSVVDVADDPDRTIVERVGTYYDDEADAGSLVREDGEWKVETDPETLRLGPPAEAALRAYLAAYRSGDCEAITTHVTAQTWSENGRLGREQFRRRCEARSDARNAAPTGLASRIVVSYYGDGDARASLTLPGLGFMSAEQIWLHQEELRWMVDGDEELARHSSPGTHLLTLRLAELRGLLVRRPVLGGLRCDDPFDSVTAGNDLAHTGMPKPPRGVAAEVAVSRGFPSCSVTVTVYELADAEAARTAATRLASELVGKHPGRQVDFPGHPTAIGVRTGCDDGCSDATVFLAHGHRVIGACSRVGDLDAAVELLEAQLRELDRR
jgi:ketosteroid isomerase-like protein